MAIYGSNVNILNGLKAMAEYNPLHRTEAMWFDGKHVVKHNPRNNKRTKLSNTKRRGR